jgi:alanyl aminopeptidase
MARWFWVVLVFALASCTDKGAWGPPAQPVTIDELREIAPVGILPKNAEPMAYRVELDIDPRRDSFSGVVEIDVLLDRPTTGFWMHGDDLSVTSVAVKAGDETLEGTWTEVLETGVSWVGFPRRTRVDGVTVTIAYSAPFDVNLAGLFRVEEQGNAYALAKSESIQARRFLPSFDEPRFKAPFNMTYLVPEDMIAIANTPQTARTPASEGYERVEFAATRPLSTYLLSVAVGNFDEVRRPDIPPNAIRDVPIPLRGYARAGKGPELEYALAITPTFVRLFEEAIEQPYPYKKLDIVAAPQWPSGATELAGAITYRESRILASENAGPAFLRSLKEVHAHEIAHMWFGNLVTPPWWDDLWLKEGFATWGEPMVLSQYEPDEGHEAQAVAEAISAMRLDSLASARAVSEPIERNEDIRNAYDAITYRKGMAVIAMADSYFGPETFRPAMGEYVAKFADQSADSADFFDVIGSATGEPDLTEAFQSFVTQNGLPLVTAELICDAPIARVKLSQTRYRPLGSKIDPTTQWTIPICVAAGDGTAFQRTCTMLRKQEDLIALEQPGCPKWVMPNAGGTGYYRFSLDAAGWAGLAEVLPRIPAGDALSTLDSAAAANQAGEMTAKALVDIVSAGTQHNDPRVVASALARFGDIIDRLPSGDARTEARARAQALVDTLRGKMGDQSSSNELISRIDAFEALTIRNAEKRGDLVQRLETFMAGTEADAIDPRALGSDLYRTALRVAVEDGDAEMFDRILAAQKSIDDPVFEQAVFSAIGRATSGDLPKRLQAMILSGEMGPRETFSLVQSQMGRSETREETWAFVNDNFSTIAANIPSQWRRRMPRFAASFCDASRTDEIKALFDANATLVSGYERALAETVESIELCDALNQATQDDLVSVFAE